MIEYHISCMFYRNYDTENCLQKLLKLSRINSIYTVYIHPVGFDCSLLYFQYLEHCLAYRVGYMQILTYTHKEKLKNIFQSVNQASL